MSFRNPLSSPPSAVNNNNNNNNHNNNDDARSVETLATSNSATTESLSNVSEDAIVARVGVVTQRNKQMTLHSLLRSSLLKKNEDAWSILELDEMGLVASFSQDSQQQQQQQSGAHSCSSDNNNNNKYNAGMNNHPFEEEKRRRRRQGLLRAHGGTLLVLVPIIMSIILAITVLVFVSDDCDGARNDRDFFVNEIQTETERVLHGGNDPLTPSSSSSLFAIYTKHAERYEDLGAERATLLSSWARLMLLSLQNISDIRSEDVSLALGRRSVSNTVVSGWTYLKLSLNEELATVDSQTVRALASCGTVNRLHISVVCVVVVVSVLTLPAAVVFGRYMTRIHENHARVQTHELFHDMCSVVEHYIPVANLTAVKVRSLAVPNGHHRSVRLTLLVSNVREFTSLAEGMTDGHAFKWLHRHYTKMEGILLNTSGTLQLTFGDTFIATFPTQHMALDFSNRVHETLDDENQVNSVRSRRARTCVGIGIHSADVCFGVVAPGTSSGLVRLDPTGRHVNIALRVERLTRVFGVRTLVTEGHGGAVQNMSILAHEFLLRPLGRVVVKGCHDEIAVWESFGADPPALRELKSATARLLSVILTSSDVEVVTNTINAAMEVEVHYRVQDPVMHMKHCVLNRTGTLEQVQCQTFG
eukprot:PhM_4_TR5289/c0_g1_i1/m.34510